MSVEGTIVPKTHVHKVVGAVLILQGRVIVQTKKMLPLQRRGLSKNEGGDANASRASTGPLASTSVIESTHSRILFTEEGNLGCTA